MIFLNSFLVAVIDQNGFVEIILNLILYLIFENDDFHE
ncbi:hypothetical protein SAMN05216269_11174 [Flavobacterium xinjiangense]|uniref:Uncharacterized protein n=1 Tax=Flavobacterium xinjiangense TaxID=178356 RepID=A0A1M7NKE0_9FLAO|nr:hypothetical protein SAMN05216269_11174 [Flavobacterium xinjiangense]